MNVYIDKVQGTFLSLLFSFHQTEEGVQHLRVCSATPPTRMYGFTRWEKQGFLCSITETVQMHGCQLIVAKGTLLLLKVLEKEMLPRWCGQMKQPCSAVHSPSAAAIACGSLLRLTSPAQISCQCNSTASALVLAHSSALRQQSGVPETCPEGQLWYTSRSTAKRCSSTSV